MSAASNISNIEGASAGIEQRFFVDTNVLVYAYDVSAGYKHERAKEIIESLWRTRAGCVSIQVLQEFLVNVTRKIPNPLPTIQAKQILSDLGYWKTHSPSARNVVEAIELHERLELSFWEAMIVRSASSLGCGILYTENLNAGQVYSGVRVENPLPE